MKPEHKKAFRKLVVQLHTGNIAELTEEEAVELLGYLEEDTCCSTLDWPCKITLEGFESEDCRNPNR